MKRFVISIFAVIAVVASFPFYSAGEGASAALDPADTITEYAHLQLDSSYIDLGSVSRDSVGEGIMRFRNTGNAPLVIHNVFSECGCTVPSYPSAPVPPGGEGEIIVHFSGKNRPLGYFHKSLRIRNNGDTPRVTFSVTGKVVK